MKNGQQLKIPDEKLFSMIFAFVVWPHTIMESSSRRTKLHHKIATYLPQYYFQLHECP